MQGSKQEDSKGSEASKEGLDRCSVRGDRNCLNRNNSKRAYQLLRDLTSEKQGRSSTIQDNSGKCLTEEQEILSRWIEYCSELLNHEICIDNAVPDFSQHPEKYLQPILFELGLE